MACERRAKRAVGWPNRELARGLGFYLEIYRFSRSWGPFLESPGNLSLGFYLLSLVAKPLKNYASRRFGNFFFGQINEWSG